MFGQSRPVVLDRYGTRRRPVPRWLILLLVGIALGAGGVIAVQQRVLPPRLSAPASAALQRAFEQADNARLRLHGELADTARRLDAALADAKRLGTELAASRTDAAGLRDVAAALVEALPPDPRGGAVEVRAARFAVDGAALAYDLVLTRPRAPAKPLSGVLQLTVTGTSGGGPERSATLKPVAISVGPYASLRGRLALPEGFTPRQATVTVLDGPGGQSLGRRVLYVK
jgi:hypothetical protein